MHFLWICVFILFFSKTSLSNPDVNLQWTNESCIGGERGLLSTGVWVTLNVSGENSSGQTGIVGCSTHRQMIEYNSSPYIPGLDSCIANYSTFSNVTFEFEQPEHGGGLCHCVDIEFINLNETFR